jgi:hypothetical protein
VSTAPLEKLAALLGIGEEVLPRGESPLAFSYTDQRFPASKLPRDDGEFARALTELRTTYGPAVSFSLSFGEWPLLDLGNNRGLEALRASEEEHFVLDLRIGKSELLKHWNLVDPNIDVRLFFFPEALERALLVPLRQLDESDTGRRIVYLIPDVAIDLEGRYVAILGGAATARWNTPPPASGERTLMVARARETDKLKWVGFDLQRLTPLQLDAAGQDRPPIAGALYAQLLVCSLLYLAGRSMRSADLWSITFATDKSAATIELGDASAVRAAMRDRWEAARTLAHRAAWVYEDERRVGDRLTIVQHAFAGVLRDSPSLEELLAQCGEIDKRIQGGWDTFLNGELDKYLAHIKELEATVDATTKGYSEQVQSLTKSLTDSMVAAVAVVIASFIAAMFKTPFDPYVFQFGSAIYAVYLFIFPLCIGLTAAWQRFEDSRITFQQRKRDYGKRLTERWVEQQVGDTVGKRERWFLGWLAATAACYLAVIALLVFGIFAVPAHVRQGKAPPPPLHLR